MINFVIENDWKWNHCRLPIKRSEKHSKRRDEQYFYQVINSQDTGPINQEKIKINLDRAFPFQADTGFVWHKSWNLPEISVGINEEDMGVLLHMYKDVKCQIMAVYPIKYSNSYYLNQIALEGTCSKSIHDNPVIFKFIKFAETSFNHNRNKFCLLAWVYGQNAYKDKDDLFCLISSPIYVDSRKQARKKDSSSIPNTVLYSPNKFMASIKGIKGSISNSAEGFISYYGAQNIRNKIKHPFYVAYHFDRIFKLYLNNEAGVSLVEALTLVQNTKTSENPISTEKNIMLLQVIDSNQKYRKKILTMMEKWRFGLIQFINQGTQPNPTRWTQIPKQQIKQCYKQHYENQVLKQEQGLTKKQQQILQQNYQLNNLQNIQEENNEPLEGQQGQGRNQGDSDEKSNQGKEPFRNYQLRTVIDLSRPKKRVKVELNQDRNQAQFEQK